MGEPITRIKGVRDILPDETRLWQFVEQTVQATMSTYGYREIRTPVFESTELFVRGIGSETEIVGKEMYSFTDQGGRSLTLKPELTAPVIRAYLQNNLGREAPLSRLYYLDALFRQERPQKGRLRQFHQFGVEAIGSPHPEQDVEVIAIAYDLCQLFAPQGLTVRLNSVGSADVRPAYLQRLRDALEPHGAKLSELDRRRLQTNPLRLFDSKDPDTQALLDQHAPHIGDYLSGEDQEHFAAVQAGLMALNIPFEHDPKLVRGLDYYTRTTFEITASGLGAQDALVGGGRYDGLVAQLGGRDTPAVGFAAGIERLLLAAGDALAQQVPSPSADVYLVVLADEARLTALTCAKELRRAGATVILETLRRSMKAQLREANRAGARLAIIFGEAELAQGSALVKNMATGAQEAVALGKLAEHLTTIMHPEAEDS
ncbi:MAG: histidine--tRNA ligase [Candidatus Marinimicrobia bacterium]|nr:histidine--tRNA ligase [Candidatus Neomarinimicrobiota bacterium]